MSQEVVVREYFDGNKDEFEKWIEEIDAKYADHDVVSFHFTFYTNWFNIVSYAVHEYLLKSRDKIVKEITEKLDEEGFESNVNVTVEADGWYRRYRIDVEARRKKVLYLGLPGLSILVRIIQILPRLLQIIIEVLIVVLAIVGISIVIEIIRGFVDIIVRVVEKAREVAYTTGNLLGILVLLALAYIIYREVRR